jgi:perosamine synthetase
MKFIDQYHPVYKEAEAKALYDLVKSGSWLSEFEKTVEFENEIKKVTGNKYAVAVNNGTIALSLALLAYGIEPDDEVIVPSLTMIATCNAVKFIGAKPVFCDVDFTTACLDVNKVNLLITKKTKAIIYVSLNGRVNHSKLLELNRLCKNKNIVLIKDDAQSLGAKSTEGWNIQDRRYADIHTLSFSPHKLISTGQGGAILTDNKEIYENIKRLKDFGRLKGGSDIHDYFGINSKFTEMQSVLGLEQLKTINDKIQFKKDIYKLYRENLDCYSIFMFEYYENYVPWFVDFYIPEHINREKLMTYLKENNIGTRAMYPLCHKQKCYSNHRTELKYFGTFGEYYSTKGIWLPSSFDLNKKDIIYICQKINEFFKDGE